MRRVRDTAGEHPERQVPAEPDDFGDEPGPDDEPGADPETDALLAELTADAPASPQILSEPASPASAEELSEPAEEEWVPETVTPLVGRMRAARTRREALERQREDVMEEIKGLIVEADAADMPKLTIAAEAGVTRQTVYNVLAGKGKEAE